MATQTLKPVSFVATKKRNEPVVVSFYTKNGKPIAFEAVKKVKTKEGVFFYAKPNNLKKH